MNTEDSSSNLRRVAEGSFDSKCAPLVTVIIPTCNRVRLLKDALKSIVDQNYRNWECVVVNDGGEDIVSTVRMIDEQERFRIVTHTTSIGPGGARNTALKLARGQIICYLDDDDLWRSDHLSTVVKALSSCPRPSFVYTDAEIVLEKIGGCGDRHVLSSLGNPYSHQSFIRDRLLVQNYIPINTWAHHLELAERVGLFDESLQVVEDWDFLLKVLRQCTPYHLPRTTAEIRVRKARDSVSRRGLQYLTQTYREIYARSDDMVSFLTRVKRMKVLLGMKLSSIYYGFIVK
ncbi:glycosyltransferase [Acidithiobacillus sp. YTS05]|nr:glycosyltransferase [Acidithiobacillus sp. YTS05]